MPSFYNRHDGAVVSMALNKYIYISVNPKFDGKIRVSYSITENVSQADQVQHDLVRTCLHQMNIEGVEITSVSDIPGEGSGLGSSSSFTVGLLQALHAYCGKPIHSPCLLAEEAFNVELEAGHKVGKQDHYAAAYGGLHFFKFEKSGHVDVEPICLQEDEKVFTDGLMLFWTGKTRKASAILNKQSRKFTDDKNAIENGIKMRDLAYRLRENLLMASVSSVGECLHENWLLKKELVDGISTPEIDEAYAVARGLGATGGKLCGAGGGGFFLLCASPFVQAKIISAMTIQFGMRSVPIGISKNGSEVIFNGREQ